MFAPPIEKITNVLNELNKCSVKIDKGQTLQISSNNIENNVSEVILSNNQQSTK